MNEDAPVTNTNGSPEQDAPKPAPPGVPTPPTVPTPADLASVVAPRPAAESSPDEGRVLGEETSPVESGDDVASTDVDVDATAPDAAPEADPAAVPEPEVEAESAAKVEAAAGTTPTTVASSEWGRVDDTGEVYVVTAQGERSIGSWKVGEPAEALSFFQRKYDDLVVQVDLLEQRLGSGAAAPDDTAAGVAKVREMLADAHAIGDLAALSTRLDAVETHIAERRAQRRAERAKALEQGRDRKEKIASEAEVIAEGTDWRSGADRLRELLDEWKALPRLDRATDDTLWRRFSTARTHYTRRRKAHFAQQAEKRDQAQSIKERLIKEAEALAESTDWGPTSRRYRELMAEWKAAGPAPRTVEESLWKRFRSAQDVFFGARAADQAQRDDEQHANLAIKEQLLAEAEALLPITNWKVARESLRSIQERWEDVGYVPRDSMRSIEGRLRRVEDEIRGAEESDWQRSNPEAHARARATVDQLRTLIADLEGKVEKARAAGNERALRDAQEALDARRGWLEQAESALDEFAG